MHYDKVEEEQAAVQHAARVMWEGVGSPGWFDSYSVAREFIAAHFRLADGRRGHVACSPSEAEFSVAVPGLSRSGEDAFKSRGTLKACRAALAAYLSGSPEGR